MAALISTWTSSTLTTPSPDRSLAGWDNPNIWLMIVCTSATSIMPFLLRSQGSNPMVYTAPTVTDSGTVIETYDCTARMLGVKLMVTDSTSGTSTADDA